MFRSIARWYISRAIDCDQAVPAWVKRLVARDPTLKQFSDQSQQLAARLRAAEFVTADDFCDRVNAPNRVATARPKRSAGLAVLAVGLAAIIFLALVPFFNKPTKDVRVSAPELSKTNLETDSVVGSAPDPIDTQRLRELIASGRTLVESLNQRGASSTGQATDFEQFGVVADIEFNQVIQPVSDLGSSYGELLARFDQHVEAENQRLIFDGIGAWQFFFHKLPQSVASLAGL